MPDASHGTCRRALIHPTDPNTVYILRTGTTAGSGVWKTTDGGATDWVQKVNGLGSLLIRWAVMNPADPKQIWAASAAGVFMTTDGGENWVAKNAGLAGDAVRTSVIVMNPGFPVVNELIVGTTNGKFYKSTNMGDNWALLGVVPVPVNHIRSMAIDYSDNSILYATGNGIANFWKSTDGGATWALKNNGITRTWVEIRHVIIHPTDPNIIFISTYHGGVFKSTDKGETWTLSSTGLGSAIADIVVNPSSPQVLYAASGPTLGNGAWKSTDKGANWFPINSGFPAATPFPELVAMVMDPDNANVLYTGAGLSFGVYGTNDAGASWTALANQPGNRTIVRLAMGSGLLYALTTDGLYATNNPGVAPWVMTMLPNPEQARSLALAPLSPATVYVGFSRNGRVYKSTDAGLTWISSDIPGDSAVLALAVAKANPAILFAGTSKAKVYRSTDGGVTWQERASGLPTPYAYGVGVSTLVIDPQDPEIVYAGFGEEGGIYKTTDGGQSWVNISADYKGYPGVNVLVLDPTERTTLYAGGAQGVWVHTAPAAPELVSPADGAQNVPTTGMLVWNSAARAAAYEVYLKQDAEPGPEDKIGEVSEPTTAFAYDGYVTNGKTYYWKVVAKNFTGTAPSAVRHFTTLPAYWHEVASLPENPTTEKPPKAGAWLAVGPDAASHRFQVTGYKPSNSGPLNPGSVIYAAKGNKTSDFYRYYPSKDSWAVLSPMPDTEPALGRSKPVGKGSCAVSDGVQYLYMVKGSGTQGFWRYRVEDGKWDTLTRVPQKIKGGNDLCHVRRGANDYVYLLAGGKTAFFRYDVNTNKWTVLDSAPYGDNKKKYAAGSWLAYDQAKSIYAHQAGVINLSDSSHYLFRYDIEGDSWDKVGYKGIPWLGTENWAVNKKKKAKDGSAGAYQDGYIYALKGGGTQGFYKYDIAGDSWEELDTVPRTGSGGTKAVKAGGDLVSYGGGVFFALKGNKCYEMWRYVEPTPRASGRTPYAGTQASAVERNTYGVMHISPNPIASGFATVRLSLPRPGPVSVSVFDVAGRSVLRAAYGVGRTASSVTLDLRRLASGVYLVRLDADGCSVVQRLVIQK